MEKIKDYLKNHKKQILILLLVAILTYFIKIFNYSISIDTEVNTNNINANDMAWISTGRWAVVMFEKILHYGNVFNPFVSNLVMIIFLILSSVVLSYLISIIIDKKEFENKILLILGAFIITSPALAEMFNFTLMTAEVSIGLFLVMLSSYFTYMAIYNKSKISYIFSILALTMAMGSYQAFFPLYVGVIAFIYAFEKTYQLKETKLKEDIFNIIKMIAIFIASYVLCTLISKILMNHYNLSSSSYLTSQITWGKVPLETTLYNIKTYIKSIMFPKNNIFFNYSYLFIFVVTLVYLIKLFIDKKGKSILNILAYLVALISPFLLCILMGNEHVVRSQMNLCFITGLFMVFILSKTKNKVLKYTVCTLTIVFSLIQFKATSDLFYSDYIRYQEDVRLTQDVINKIDQMDNLDKNREDMVIVFVGMYQPKSTAVAIRGETMGHSFYEWDPLTELASNYRINGFAKTLGYKYIMPTVDEVKKAQNISDKLEVYPNKKSIRIIDNIIVVRVS